MNAVLHRLGQGASAVLAFATPLDLSLAQRYLTRRELAAFKRMSRADQLHSLKVLRATLRVEPMASPTLCAAALLHDVGKSRIHLAVWQKTLAVLMLRFAAGFCGKLSTEESTGLLRAPFVVRQHHARWSGEILRDCASAEAVIWLAEKHHDDAALQAEHEHVSLLKALQAADSRA